MKKKQTIIKKQFSDYFPLLSFFIFILAFALRYQGVLGDTLPALLLVVALFGGATYLLSRFKKMLPVADLISLAVLFLLSFVDKSAVLNDTLYGLAQPLLFAFVGFFLLRIYDVKLDFNFSNFKKISIIVGVSLLFAYLFLLLNEPFPTFIKGSMLVLILYTFFVSLGEELVFRGVSFSLIKEKFSGESAVHLQASIFTIIHLLGIVALYRFFAIGGSLLLSGSFAYANVLIYAVALYGFAVVAARYALHKGKINILYPVLFHWLVNFLNLVILIV